MSKTKMLHNTRRRTQPWKTGLPIDYTPPDAYGPIPLYAWYARAARWVYAQVPRLTRYWRHPDVAQERLFFGLLRECLDKGVISADLIAEEIRQDHVRHDAFEVIEHTAPLAA